MARARRRRGRVDRARRSSSACSTSMCCARRRSRCCASRSRQRRRRQAAAGFPGRRSRSSSTIWRCRRSSLAAPVIGVGGGAVGVRLRHPHRGSARGEAHRRPAGPRRLALRRPPLRACRKCPDRRPEARRAEGRARRGAAAAARPAGDRAGAFRQRPARPLAGQSRHAGGRRAARLRRDVDLAHRRRLPRPRQARCGARYAWCREDYAALVAGESGVDLELSRLDDGSIAVNTATLHSDGVDLAASGVLGADLVPQQAKLSLSIGRAGRAELPFLPGGVSLASLRANAELSSGETAPWRVEIAAEGAEGAFGRSGGPGVERGRAGTESGRSRRARHELHASKASAQGVRRPIRRSAMRVGATLKLSGSGIMVRRPAGQRRQSATCFGRRERELCRNGDARRAFRQLRGGGRRSLALRRARRAASSPDRPMSRRRARRRRRARST